MKRFAAICLSLVYLAMVSGVVVNVHYCMGKVASVGIGHSDSDKCDDCGMENSGCCKDQVLVVKLADSHSISTAHAKLVKPEPTQPVLIQATGLLYLQRYSPAVHINNSPPLAIDGRTQCILNSVFRI